MVVSVVGGCLTSAALTDVDGSASVDIGSEVLEGVGVVRSPGGVVLGELEAVGVGVGVVGHLLVGDLGNVPHAVTDRQ